ncbi:DUF1707 domain-containing protein [Streptomyces sp. NBC_01387]|uniref:DUF1707 SHOCT-like domain-containing protein n=1 Tax=unclassified Streptomyces TaxID=2593676 RepID=UPI00202571E0|nr:MULTISPECIES: DUF1707 domain-containing protein [unclassified Streptomyces]MCX4550868.1 DUF1707 domain-containing protein [Streptomyces sp. NBC_01500]WSC22291.1 DUF1707 domain-containing protein [Streptomyces sp. NBC_01766]
MTNELPEMRASDAERERVAETLREAVAEGRLDMEEFEHRLDATYQARTHGELEPLVRDLPAPGSFKAGTPATSLGKRDEWADRIGGTATSSKAVAVFGGFHRKGRWTVGRTVTTFAMFGGGELDLREARFEARDVTIRCFALFGGIAVIVPPDLHCDVNGIGLMGGFGDSGSGEGTPGSPRVKVTGFAMFGGVGVERKVTRAEKQRLKEEARARRKELG